MKKSILKTLVATVLVLVLSVTAVAWFFEAEDINPDVHGSAITGYFHAGDGSKEHPYQLNNAKHVYNLAWLQYIGYLNEEDQETGKIKQLYFELIDNIDMDGIILPPIGTTDEPFVGHFDGNGYCISNLVVSNYLSGENNQLKIVQRPLSVTEIDPETVSIVGFFGVVGAYGDITADMLANDSDKTDITQKVNSVHDLFLENLTVRTETTSSLIGLVAGYANGSIMNVGVAGDSGIQLGTKTQPLQPKEAGDIIYAASFYSLIGQYNATNIVWKDAPTGGLVDGGEDTDQGAGWGGSINMNQLRLRITYIAGAVGLTSYKISGAYGANVFFGANQQNYVDGTYVNSVASLVTGTVMPLSINQSIFESAVTLKTHGSITLKTIDYYLNNTDKNAEPVVKENSGYIVGGGTRTSISNKSWVDFKNDYVSGGQSKAGGSYTAGIAKSIGTSLNKEATFPENNLHMLTISATDGKTYAISDDYNVNANTWIGNNYSDSNTKTYTDLGLKKYSVIEDGKDVGVRNIFVNTTKGSNLIQSILFYSKIDTQSYEKTTVNDVMLLGTEYDGYEMLNGAINFSISGKGIATAIVATNSAYGTTIDTLATISHTLFQVMQVHRDANKKITEVVPIDTIHEVKNGSSVDYKYNLGADFEQEGYTLVYDYAKMGLLKETGAAYYFEIPLTDGEYAIGATTGLTSNYPATLIYLDIGANGDKVVGDDDVDAPGETAEHQIEGVTFVDSDAIAAKSTEGYSIVTFKVVISESGYGKSHGGLLLVFNRSSKTNITVTETDTGGVFGVTELTDDKDLTVGIGPPSG
ncbi:MAG: hypothetical protein IKV20_03880 [Clostridia bacterium]|nr:hypothetical protein [Clostridia bacterium]